MGVTQQGFTQFLGLRTDTPASKLSPDYSPDCSDDVFSVGGFSTRPPFLAQLSLPNEAVWRKEFTAKDGTEQILALDITGALYIVNGGVPTLIDNVAPGSSVSSVTAYGREYMSFFIDGEGSDAPRQWDGKKLYRVSQGGPGAAPTVTNVSIPASGIASGSRVSNEVTIVTSSPHGLKKGYLVTIAGLDAQIQSITSIVIDNDTLPGVATITTPAPHGLVPGNSISISGIQQIAPGGGHLVSWARVDTVVTVTMSAAHDLTPGTSVSVELGNDGFGPAIIDTVPSPTTFTFTNSGGNDSGTTGDVFLPWPFDPDTLFNIQATPTTTTFQIALNFVTSTWTTGFLSFNWNGQFYVESVLSATSFTYRQLGPDASFVSGAGTVTPTGQMAAGDHLVCQHFITDTGFITAPSPSFRFTASGGQYVQVDNLAIGPANVTGRILSFTGANGSAFAILLVPAQVNGQQISTSTVVNDNTSTSVIIDFADTTLLSAAATRIDVPGNNLFQQVALNLPRGVDWYFDRLFWIGEKNTVIGFLNMDMAGGNLSGSPLPLGWTTTGSLAVTQLGFMPVLSGTGTISQPADVTLRGDAIIQQNLNYSLRAWTAGEGSVTATLSSASAGFTSTATLPPGSGYVTANFSAVMPANIQDDLTFTVTLTSATIRDMQLIFADNPNRNPIARASYLKNPEAFDALTGNIGPNDDNSELRAIFVLQESLYFITENRLYSVQQIGNSEPSSWDPLQVSDKCGTFNANSLVTGKGWAAWGGELGAFWFAGAIPQKVSAIIAPTWRNIANVQAVFDDPDFERVYFGVTSKAGVKSMLVYDYHEVYLGGSGKWCPWNRPLNWACDSSTGPLFLFGSKFYSLSTGTGVADDDLGPIGGYYVFSPVGSSMLRKLYDYMGLQISGSGVMTPFLYSQSLSNLTKTLKAQELSTLQDIVAEWPINLTGRLLFLKLGQPGVQFSLDNAAVMFGNDPNAQISGVR